MPSGRYVPKYRSDQRRASLRERQWTSRGGPLEGPLCFGNKRNSGAGFGGRPAAGRIGRRLGEMPRRDGKACERLSPLLFPAKSNFPLRAATYNPTDREREKADRRTRNTTRGCLSAIVHLGPPTVPGRCTELAALDRAPHRPALAFPTHHALAIPTCCLISCSASLALLSTPAVSLFLLTAPFPKLTESPLRPSIATPTSS